MCRGDVGSAGDRMLSRQVLPALPPSRDRPSIAIEPGPPPPGTGRVVLDSTDGPTRFKEVVAYASGEAYGARGSDSRRHQHQTHLRNLPRDLPYGITTSCSVATMPRSVRKRQSWRAPNRASTVCALGDDGPVGAGLAVVIDDLPVSFDLRTGRDGQSSKAPATCARTTKRRRLPSRSRGRALGVGLVVDFAVGNDPTPVAGSNGFSRRRDLQEVP